MFRKNRIEPLAIEAPARSRSGGAVDHIAAATGIMVLALAVTQLVAPEVASPLTAIDRGTAGGILALQWIALGGLLSVGGIIRTRAVSIFAADFLMISGIAGVAVCLFEQQPIIPIVIHAAVAALGFISSSFARLTDKADLKRDLRLMREQANQ